MVVSLLSSSYLCQRSLQVCQIGKTTLCDKTAPKMTQDCSSFSYEPWVFQDEHILACCNSSGKVKPLDHLCDQIYFILVGPWPPEWWGNACTHQIKNPFVLYGTQISIITRVTMDLNGYMDTCLKILKHHRLYLDNYQLPNEKYSFVHPWPSLGPNQGQCKASKIQYTAHIFATKRVKGGCNGLMESSWQLLLTMNRTMLVWTSHMQKYGLYHFFIASC